MSGNSSRSPVNRRRASTAVVAIAGSVAVFAGIFGWAVATILRPPVEVSEQTSYTFAEVTEGEVSSTLSLSVIASWRSISQGLNQAQGVVTERSIANGALVQQGQTIYTVDLNPVTIASGDVPSFRDIGEGTTGRDVAQLQSMLQDVGKYDGAIDGIAGSKTIQAMNEWRKSVGLAATGQISRGDVIYVPQLPSRINLEDMISRGTSLSGGERAVSVYDAAPVFVLPVTDSQASLIPAGTKVSMQAPDGSTWIGAAGTHERDATTETVSIAITAPDGGEICGKTCDSLSLEGETQIPATVITMAPISGAVVPSAALVTESSGAVRVIDEDGNRIPVDVEGSARGMSVVSGVEPGQRVRVPGSSGTE